MSQRRGRTLVLVKFFKEALSQKLYQNLYYSYSDIVILELPDSRSFKNSENFMPYIKILKDYAICTTRRCITEKEYNETKQAIFCAIKKSSHLITCGPKERNKIKFRFKDASDSRLQIEAEDESMETEDQSVDVPRPNPILQRTDHFETRPNWQLSVDSEGEEQNFAMVSDPDAFFTNDESSCASGGGPMWCSSVVPVINKEQKVVKMYDPDASFFDDEGGCSSGYERPFQEHELNEGAFGSGLQIEAEDEPMEIEDQLVDDPPPNPILQRTDHFETRPYQQLSVHLEEESKVYGYCSTSDESFEEIDQIISTPHPDEDAVIQDIRSSLTVNSSEEDAEEEGQQHEAPVNSELDDPSLDTFIDLYAAISDSSTRRLSQPPQHGTM